MNGEASEKPLIAPQLVNSRAIGVEQRGDVIDDGGHRLTWFSARGQVRCDPDQASEAVLLLANHPLKLTYSRLEGLELLGLIAGKNIWHSMNLCPIITDPELDYEGYI